MFPYEFCDFILISEKNGTETLMGIALNLSVFRGMMDSFTMPRK